MGIYLLTKLLIVFKWGTLPSGVTWSHVISAGFLTGMGFTMSLFINDLAFKDPEYQIIAKVAVLVASVISDIIGYILLMRTSKVNNE